MSEENKEVIENQPVVDNQEKQNEQDETYAEVTQLQSQFKAMQEQLSSLQEEKEKILQNKDSILAEKKELESKFKGVDEDAFSAFLEFNKQKKDNELLQMIQDGKIDAVRQRFTEDLTKDFNQERSTYEQQAHVLKEQVAEFESKLQAQMEDNLQMQKRSWMKELVGRDQSFVGDEYFDKFYRLYSPQMDIDKDSGKIYALGDTGSRMVDTRTGDLMDFETFYNKEKATSGLFWKGGSGTGVKSGNGGGDFVGDPSKWSHSDKIAFINENGNAAYADALKRSRNK